MITDHKDVGNFTYGSQVFQLSPIIIGSVIRRFSFINQPVVAVHMPASVTTDSPCEAEPIWCYCKNNCWSGYDINILEQGFNDPEFENIFRTTIKNNCCRKTVRVSYKNPWSTLRVGYLGMLFPDAPFIYITRDPNRQLQSQLDLENICQRVLAGLEHFNESFSDQFYPPRVFFRNYKSDAYIALYAKNRTLATAMSIVDFDKEFDNQIRKADIEHRLLRVRYEDLVNNMSSIMRNTFSFLRLSPDEAERIIELNETSNLRRNLVSGVAPIPKFDDETEDHMSDARIKHGY